MKMRFHSHANFKNSFTCEWLLTGPRFDGEAQISWEIGHSNHILALKAAILLVSIPKLWFRSDFAAFPIISKYQSDSATVFKTIRGLLLKHDWLIDYKWAIPAGSMKKSVQACINYGIRQKKKSRKHRILDFSKANRQGRFSLFFFKSFCSRVVENNGNRSCTGDFASEPFFLFLEQKKKKSQATPPGFEPGIP